MKKDQMLKSIQGYDWRKLKRLASAQANADLNKFMDALPQNVGQTMIYIVATAWIFAGGASLYTMMQMQTITELRTDIAATDAVRPAVPKVAMKPVGSSDIKRLAERMAEIYKDLDIKAHGASLSISADTTVHFGQFRESIGYAQVSASGTRADIEKMCVGRECSTNPLSVTLKINKVTVN